MTEGATNFLNADIDDIAGQLLVEMGFTNDPGAATTGNDWLLGSKWQEFRAGLGDDLLIGTDAEFVAAGDVFSQAQADLAAEAWAEYDLAIAAGVDIYTVGKVSIASTQRYAHLADDQLVAAAEAGASKLDVNWSKGV